MLRILVISLFVANLLLLGFRDNKSEVEPEPEPESVAPRSVEENPDIPTIHLFSEMIEDQGLLTGNRRCFSLGPFHSIEDRDDTRSRLVQGTSGISERETQALVEKGYWVFMPPYASLLIANQELLSLQALGLEDIGVIYNGEWKNAISLGYFLRQENANRRKKSLEEKGYSPLIRVQRQSEPRYWLDYEQNPGSELIALNMIDRPNDFMQRALPCPQEDLFELTETQPQVPAQASVQQQAPAMENEPDSDESANSEEDGSGSGEGVSTEENNSGQVEDTNTELIDSDPDEGASAEEDDAGPGENASTEVNSSDPGKDASIEVNDSSPGEDASTVGDDSNPGEGANTEDSVSGPGEGANTEDSDSGPGEGAGDDAEETVDPVTGELEALDTGEPGEPEGDQLEAPTETEATDPELQQGEDPGADNSTDGESQEAVETPPESAIKTEEDSETKTGPPE